MTEDDDDKIVLMIAEGKSIRATAAAFETTVHEINAVLKRKDAELFDGNKLRRKMLLEDARLAALAEPHYEAGKNGDVASGVLYVKIAERRSTMFGSNAPVAHSIQIMTAQSAPGLRSSTEEIADVLDTLLGISGREAALRDKGRLGGPGLTADEQFEYDQMVSEREAKRDAEREEERVAREARAAAAKPPPMHEGQ